MNLPRRLLPVLLVLTVSTLLGHICTLPAGDEWAAVATHQATSSAESHDSDGAHIHNASCDAPLSKPAPLPSPSHDSVAAIPSPSIDAAPSIPAPRAKPSRGVPARR